MSFSAALIRAVVSVGLLLVLQGARAPGDAVPIFPQAPTSIWPQTVMGWVTFFISIGAGIGMIVAWGRLLEKLNGYGQRLTDVEGKVDKLAGLVAEQTRSLDLVRAVHEAMLKQLGKAERSAEQCGEDMGEYAREIGSKLDAWRREQSGDVAALRNDFHEVDKTLSMKLEGLEREVRLTRTPTRREA